MTVKLAIFSMICLISGGGAALLRYGIITIWRYHTIVPPVLQVKALFNGYKLPGAGDAKGSAHAFAGEKRSGTLKAKLTFVYFNVLC